jgi:hypothetical protein
MSPYLGNIALCSTDLESIVLIGMFSSSALSLAFARTAQGTYKSVVIFSLTVSSASAYIWHGKQSVPIIKTIDIMVLRSSPKALGFFVPF